MTHSKWSLPENSVYIKGNQLVPVQQFFLKEKLGKGNNFPFYISILVFCILDLEKI